MLMGKLDKIDGVVHHVATLEEKVEQLTIDQEQQQAKIFNHKVWAD